MPSECHACKAISHDGAINCAHCGATNSMVNTPSAREVQITTERDQARAECDHMRGELLAAGITLDARRVLLDKAKADLAAAHDIIRRMIAACEARYEGSDVVLLEEAAALLRGEGPRATCREHGFGLLECDCGMRFTAPLHVKSFMLIQCPACGQSYAGYEDCCNGMWKKITEQERTGGGTDGPDYRAGRHEGHADVCAELRKIIDSQDKNHWNKDGLLKEVVMLYGAYVPPPYLGVGRTGDCDCADDFTCAEHRGIHVLRDHK